MSGECEIKATVLGSFKKFKPEIDLAIQELKESVDVLGPEPGSVIVPQKGGLYLPYNDFAPLPSEVGMTPEEVEEAFIENCVTKSDFVYAITPEGYVGETVVYEMRKAAASGVSIYTNEPIKPNPELKERLKNIMPGIKTMPIRDAVTLEQEAKILEKLGQIHPAKVNFAHPSSSSQK